VGGSAGHEQKEGQGDKQGVAFALMLPGLHGARDFYFGSFIWQCSRGKWNQLSHCDAATVTAYVSSQLSMDN